MDDDIRAWLCDDHYADRSSLYVHHTRKSEDKAKRREKESTSARTGARYGLMINNNKEAVSLNLMRLFYFRGARSIPVERPTKACIIVSLLFPAEVSPP